MKNEWRRIGNGEIKIKLTQGKVAIADEADLPILARYRWCANWNGRRWYAVTALWKRDKKTKLERMHRILLQPPSGVDVDHINGNGLDNRRSNLRLASRSQNNANKPKYKRDATSKYKGVRRTVNIANPWGAEIKVNGRNLHLGKFPTEEAAALAYNDAALEHFGEFAFLNKVPT